MIAGSNDWDVLPRPWAPSNGYALFTPLPFTGNMIGMCFPDSIGVNVWLSCGSAIVMLKGKR